MYRYFIELSYNGKNYHGWQLQPNAVTVQEILNKSLSLILKTTIETTGAGRTDTGVHANYFVAHFDISNKIEHPQTLIGKLNSFLPFDISIKNIFQVANGAHARFSAVSRTYEYHLCTIKNPFLNDFVWHFYKSLDTPHMNEAASVLLEFSDFTSFSKVDTDSKTNICKIKEAYWKISDDGVLVFTITADRFLRNMVRAIVGTLVEVGLHKISIDDFRIIIESKNRCNAGQSVPSQGLFLTKIEYPEF